MDFKGIRVLILDGYGRQVATIAQQMYDLGCVITTLNCSKLDVGYTSRYPVKKLLEPQTRNNQDELKKVLDREILSGAYDVVFPMLEPSTEVLLKNEDIYKQYVRIISAPYDAFLKAYDKQETMLACMDNDIPCPITKRDDESLEEFIEKVGFPLVVKPRKGTGSIGFHCVKNREEFDKLLNQGLKIEENVIQKYISQTDTQYISFVMLDDNHQLKSAVIGDKSRWYPVDGGATSYVRTVNRPDIVEYSVKLLKAIGWKGFAHIDLIGDPDEEGVPKVMEINGRIPASIKLDLCAKIPLMEQELQYAMGTDVDDYSKVLIPEGIGLRYFQTDFMWFFKSPNRFKAKPSWFDFSNSKDMIWSCRDPIPFFSYTISHLLSYKEDMKKRKRM